MSERGSQPERPPLPLPTIPNCGCSRHCGSTSRVWPPRRRSLKPWHNCVKVA